MTTGWFFASNLGFTMADGQFVFTWIYIWCVSFALWFMAFCLFKFIAGMVEALRYKSTRGLRR